ncbi:MAG: methyltransferase [Pseudomonadota bacterium]
MAAIDPLPDHLTYDAFLGGKIRVLQPKAGFRSGVDAVLLAASVPAKPDETILELGCGVGVAGLCLHARVDRVTLTGVEIQPDYAALAEKNAASLSARMTIVASDLRSLPHDLRQQQFTHVMMNPPYFDRSQGSAAPNVGRDLALAGDTPLTDWLEVGLKRLAPKGTLTIIQHITRLPEVLGGLEGRLGSLILQPIAGRPGMAPGLFLLQGRHSGRAPFQMNVPLVMHEGAKHTADAESYTTQIQGILRDGAALPLSD